MRNSPTAAAFLLATSLAVSAFGAEPRGPLGAGAQDPAPKAAPAEAKPEADAPKPSEEEIAVRAVADAFVKAFNEGDAKAVADLFVENGEIHREDEGALKGRAEIETSFKESFDANPGMQLEIVDTAIRFITKDLAVEEGAAVVTYPVSEEGETPETLRSRYTVHYAKVDGKWLQASVRDLPDSEPTVEDRLAELGWMIGEWVDEGEHGVAVTTAKFDDTGKYIIRDFKTTRGGDALISGTERIGWDPLTKQFKSWVFDSEGGYGEALWTKTGQGWVLKARGVLPDGRVASATRYYLHVNKDRVVVRSSDRVAGGETRPDVDEITMVRKAPAPSVRGAKKSEETRKSSEK